MRYLFNLLEIHEGYLYLYLCEKSVNWLSDLTVGILPRLIGRFRKKVFVHRLFRFYHPQNS